MKDDIVNRIVCMLDSMDVDTDGIADRLYIILKDCQIVPLETQLALRDDALNEQLLNRFLASKMVKGCTKRTIQRYKSQIAWTLNRFGKPCTQYKNRDYCRMCPIADWTKEDVGAYIVTNQIPKLRWYDSFGFDGRTTARLTGDAVRQNVILWIKTTNPAGYAKLLERFPEFGCLV